MRSSRSTRCFRMNSSVRSRSCFTIFGGPNGSGKSTAYDRFLQAGFDSGEYLNPDEIAKSFNAGPTGGPAVDLRAGREVIQRTRSLMEAGRSLVRESTLTSREIVRSAERAKAAGYRLVMVFVAVSSTDTTQGRVAIRVAKGGHDIPAEAQERRFPRSFENAPKVARLVDAAYFLDKRRVPAQAGRDGYERNDQLPRSARGGMGRPRHDGFAAGGDAQVTG